MARLESVDYYEPILVDDSLSTEDKFARYCFFNTLELPCPVHLFRYHCGSQLGNVCYVWKIPDNESDKSLQKQNAVVTQVKAALQG